MLRLNRLMEIFRTLSQRSTWWIALLVVAIMHSSLWAQIAGEEEPKNRWVLSYALVFLLFGLSLYSITRGSTRRRN